MALAKNFGELKASGYACVPVKDEMRANLVRKIRANEKLFSGIVGYDDSVVPQITNAILARHKDPLASVTTVLNRLVDYGEARSLSNDRGRRVWEWVSDGATASASIRTA